MNRIKIGVRLESFDLPLRKALQEAQRLGVAGVQADAVGDLSPDALSQTGRREFRNLLRAHNLELAALGCPLRQGLDVAENQQPRIEHVMKCMSLSFDLGARTTLTHPGRISTDLQKPNAFLMKEAFEALGQHGDRVGAVLALEAGLESGETLASYLAAFDTGSLGANLVPANWLVNGWDVKESTKALHGKCFYCVAKDARKTTAGPSSQEVPLGHGDIDWLDYLGLLEEIEYRGWMTVVRDSGDKRIADLNSGVAFLRRLGI